MPTPIAVVREASELQVQQIDPGADAAVDSHMATNFGPSVLYAPTHARAHPPTFVRSHTLTHARKHSVSGVGRRRMGDGGDTTSRWGGDTTTRGYSIRYRGASVLDTSPVGPESFLRAPGWNTISACAYLRANGIPTERNAASNPSVTAADVQTHAMSFSAD